MNVTATRRGACLEMAWIGGLGRQIAEEATVDLGTVYGKKADGEPVKRPGSQRHLMVRKGNGLILQKGYDTLGKSVPGSLEG